MHNSPLVKMNRNLYFFSYKPTNFSFVLDAMSHALKAKSFGIYVKLGEDELSHETPCSITGLFNIVEHLPYLVVIVEIKLRGNVTLVIRRFSLEKT